MIQIQRTRIDVEAVVDRVRRDDAGAIVVFLGSVRSDPDVRALEYEVYKPMALRTLAELVERAKEKFGILEMSIVHRVGRVPVGGDSVVIACAAAHRSEAFAACTWAMDEVKRIVPIWKTEASPRKPRTKPEGHRRKHTAVHRKVP
jgi:molybdopterin synthase catalytic subunit